MTHGKRAQNLSWETRTPVSALLTLSKLGKLTLGDLVPSREPGGIGHYGRGRLTTVGLVYRRAVCDCAALAALMVLTG